MTAITCNAPACPRPNARADKWCSLTGFGLPGVAHEKCARRLYKLRGRGAPLDTPRGRHTTPLAPCSSPFCPAPLAGYRKPGAGPSRPVRRVADGRTYCLACFLRACRRLKAGLDPDAPDDDDDTGPEPTEAEVERTTRPYRLMAANRRLRRLIYRPPRPPSLDELRGADFGRAVVEAFDRKDIVAIYGSIELHEEIR